LPILKLYGGFSQHLFFYGVKMYKMFNPIFSLLERQKIKIVVTIFGQTRELTCELLSYAKPFIQIQTKQGIRILNENVVKEIIPLEQKVEAWLENPILKGSGKSVSKKT